MKPEYFEGAEVAEKFEEAMKILFQTPKIEVEKKRPKTLSTQKSTTDDRGV
jgi:hypothetical protein